MTVYECQLFTRPYIVIEKINPSAGRLKFLPVGPARRGYIPDL